MNALLQQAQQMQEQLQRTQEELAEKIVEGSVGGVTVQVNGVGELVGVTFRTGIVDGADEESLTDLGDMVVAAYRDAKARADAQAGQALGPLAGGLGGLSGGPGGGAAGGLPGGGSGQFGF
ncbi:YbaB/EbfC family nucleoid-associated protein [Nocardioides sp. CBS4Y-1]|uniref:Nucleoid-associated protein ISG29_16055 n=2 Tax=Nocardioides acrostichi TaxID=2784339 RepID=A0A930Y8M0_9ACTN|nr:YbaB/EbfC family nucleoid-associated protein [Nocardioides acrostichi]